jgi:hypothetical protein
MKLTQGLQKLCLLNSCIIRHGNETLAPIGCCNLHVIQPARQQQQQQQRKQTA